MVTSANRPFRPCGNALEVMYDKSPELMFCGPAGTGKSIAIVNKCHAIAEKYAGARILFCRKTRSSMTQSVMECYENEVLPEGHPAARGAQRENRSVYHYPNGSEIVCAGLDKPEKILSTRYDIIYPQEAIELELADWEMLASRLRSYVVPYQQILGCTNPGPTSHWILSRAEKGHLKMLQGRHEDNPLFFDQETGELTEKGKAYIANLDRYTGARYKRLRLGEWCAAEGQIYAEWDASVHLVPRFDIPDDWARYISVDFGYVHPLVIQHWAHSPDDVLVLTEEIYITEELVEDACERLVDMLGNNRPREVISDHDAEDRATFERHTQWRTTPADKSVLSGIQLVAERLRDRRLLVFNDARVHPADSSLADKGLPTCTADEFSRYVWDDKALVDRPVKRFDDGMDATRYMVAHIARRRRGTGTVTVRRRAKSFV